MSALATKGRLDHSRFPFRPFPDKGEVFFGDALLLHQQAEPPGGLSVFCHEHEPARFPVEPVHDGNLTAIRNLESEQML